MTYARTKRDASQYPQMPPQSLIEHANQTGRGLGRRYEPVLLNDRNPDGSWVVRVWDDEGCIIGYL